MLKLMNYRKTRALQICMVFSITILIQSLLMYAHAGWIGFAVIMIYAGFDKGASLQRTTHRFWGAVLGLLLSYMLWFLGQLDYRLIRVIVPIIVFMAYFSLGKLYAFPTIFTVTLTVLGADFYKGNNYAVNSFFFEYLLSTVVAFLICVVFDSFIFKNSNLSRKFYLDLQKNTLANLNELFAIVTCEPLRYSRYLKTSVKLNTNVLDLYAFVDTAKDDIADINLMAELAFFSSELQQAYHNIRRLFILAPLKNDILVLETNNILVQLAKVNQNQRIKYIGE